MSEFGDEMLCGHWCLRLRSFIPFSCLHFMILPKFSILPLWQLNCIFFIHFVCVRLFVVFISITWFGGLVLCHSQWFENRRPALRNLNGLLQFFIFGRTKFLLKPVAIRDRGAYHTCRDIIQLRIHEKNCVNLQHSNIDKISSSFFFSLLNRIRYLYWNGANANNATFISQRSALVQQIVQLTIKISNFIIYVFV